MGAVFLQEVIIPLSLGVSVSAIFVQITISELRFSVRDSMGIVIIVFIDAGYMPHIIVARPAAIAMNYPKGTVIDPGGAIKMILRYHLERGLVGLP